MKNNIYKKKIISLNYGMKINLIVFSKIDSSKIDLIILLYKSFEVGIGNKEIIKKNIAVLGFSISKVFKEFRYDVINEFKKKEKIIYVNLIYLSIYFPYNIFMSNNVNNCGCGRSPTGKCIGWHTLSEEEYQKKLALYKKKMKK